MRAVIIVMTVFVLFTVGCASSIKSSKIANGVNDTQEGLIYHMPMRLMKLTAQRKPIPSNPLVLMKKLQEEVGNHKDEMSRLFDNLKKDIEKLDSLENGGSGDVIEGLRNDIISKRKKIESLNDKIKQLTTNIEFLKKASQAISDVDDKNKPKYIHSIKLELEPPIPDPNRRYVASLNHNAFHDDSAGISTTAEGLLTSAELTSVGRQADVLVELAKFAAVFISPGIGLGLTAGNDSKNAAFAQADSTCNSLSPDQYNSLREYTLELRFDPASESVENINCALTRTAFPYEIDIKPGIKNSNSDWLVMEWGSVHQNATSNASFDINTIISRISELEASIDDIKIHNKIINILDEKIHNEQIRLMPTLSDGLYYPRPIPYQVSIVQRVSNVDNNEDVKEVPLQSVVVMLPNNAPLGIIPYEAGGFTRTVTEVAFENGLLTNWSTDKPSVAFEVARLPLRIVSSFFEAVSQLVQLKFDISSKEKTIAEAQAAQIKAETEIFLLKSCLDNAGTSFSAQQGCFDSGD